MHWGVQKALLINAVYKRESFASKNASKLTGFFHKSFYLYICSFVFVGECWNNAINLRISFVEAFI